MKRPSILLWDLPTRIAHWSLVVLVSSAVITAKIGGNAMQWHGAIGLAILGVVVFRIVWGVVGSTYARFTQFLPRPDAVLAYLRGQWRGVGHNPLGALSTIALLALMGAQALAGAFSNDDIAFYGPLYRAVSGELSALLTGLHRRGEWLVYGLVSLHVLAVLFHTHVKKDDLITPMITGMKPIDDSSAEPARGGGSVALGSALVAAAVAIWAASGGLLPPPPEASPSAPAAPSW